MASPSTCTFQSLVQAAQDAASWGLLSVPGQTSFTDSLARSLPPKPLLDEARRSGRGRWGSLLLLDDVLGLAVNPGTASA